MTFVEYGAEVVGTFFFLSIILSHGKPIPIALGLLAAIYLAGDISGGHFNPAVTFMIALKDPNFNKFIPYVLSQFAGAGLAWFVFTRYVQPLRQK